MKKLIKNPLVILAVAIILLVGSSVGATRAALIYQSYRDVVTFSTAEIHCQLLENSDVVEDSEDLSDDGTTKIKQSLLSWVGEGESINIGQTYEEKLTVVNNSSEDYAYDEYVRVIVTKSWMNEDGTKNTTLDPSLIDLHILDGWYYDESASTSEQEIYYLAIPLENGYSVDLSDTITINNEITKIVSTSDEKNGFITTTYEYNGEYFSLEVEVDAVQTHHAVDAIKGAWGIDVTIDENGAISSDNFKAVK